jgi:hypothetical protein
MKHHLGQGAYEHAERLQELDVNTIAQSVLEQNENLIHRSSKTGQPGEHEYDKVDCYIPSAVYVMKRAWAKIAEFGTTADLDRSIGSIFFSALWAVYLVTGTCGGREFVTKMFKSIFDDLKFEGEQRVHGQQVFAKYLETPCIVRLNCMDHAFIDQVAAGADTHTELSDRHTFVTHAVNLCV